jgi:hypothetical protein
MPPIGYIINALFLPANGTLKINQNPLGMRRPEKEEASFGVPTVPSLDLISKGPTHEDRGHLHCRFGAHRISKLSKLV